MDMHTGVDLNADPGMVVTPRMMQQNQNFEQQDYNDQNLGGKEVADKYTTALNPKEQEDYSTKFSPEDSEDYDMQGWYKANPGADPNDPGVHYPDTFKKPNHPTFSDQSQYSNDQTQGGKWTTGSNGEDIFTPGTQNIVNGMDNTIDYLKKNDPNVILNYDLSK
jgi:hypothetical protein